MVKVNVNGGACNFNTIINILSEDGQDAAIDLTTECPNLKPLEKELKEVDAYEECFAKFGGDSTIFKLCNKFCRHAACPVPTAIIKGVEAECNLALPRNIEIKISKE
jgi:hypothetical protein